jgi:hypothetical protein
MTMMLELPDPLAGRLRLVADELGGRGLDLGTICRALLREAADQLEAKALGEGRRDASLVTADANRDAWAHAASSATNTAATKAG